MDPVRIMQLSYESEKAKELELLSKRLIVDFNIDQLLSYEHFYENNKKTLDNYVRSEICQKNIGTTHDDLETFLNKCNDYVSPHFVIEIIKYTKFRNQVDTMKAKFDLDNCQELNEIYKQYVSQYGENYTEPNNINIFTFILKYEFKFEKIDKKEIIKEVSQIYNEIVISRNQREFLQMIERDSEEFSQLVTIDNVDNLNWLDFECFLERLFKSMGYKVVLTKATGDQGADLIIEKFKDRIAVQAKLYFIGYNVGNSAVQQAISASYYYKCNRRMVVTNAYFTKSAKELAKRSDVILVDRDLLEYWLKNVQQINGNIDILKIQ